VEGVLEASWLLPEYYLVSRQLGWFAGRQLVGKPAGQQTG